MKKLILLSLLLVSTLASTAAHALSFQCDRGMRMDISSNMQSVIFITPTALYSGKIESQIDGSLVYRISNYVNEQGQPMLAAELYLPLEVLSNRRGAVQIWSHSADQSFRQEYICAEAM